MSSVAPFSPVTVHYQEPNDGDLGPIIIHHYVTEDNPGQKPFADSSLNEITSGISAELCRGENIQSADPEFSEIKTNNVEEVFVSEIDQKEVALLITDHETGNLILDFKLSDLKHSFWVFRHIIQCKCTRTSRGTMLKKLPSNI